MTKLLLLVLLCAAPAAAQVGGGPGARANTPGASGYIVEPEMAYRLFKKLGKWEPKADATFRWQTEQRTSYKSLELGSYFRAHRNLKLGAFYKMQYGARYDGDWIETGNRREWQWRDTVQRVEHVLILDASPRVQLPWLPGEDWVLTGKTQYHHSASLRYDWIRFAPELTYHLVSGLEPVASFTLQYDAMIALDQEHETFYDQWTYLGALWHANKNVSVGPRVGIRQWIWKDTQHFREESRGVQYKAVYRALVLGVDFVARL